MLAQRRRGPEGRTRPPIREQRQANDRSALADQQLPLLDDRLREGLAKRVHARSRYACLAKPRDPALGRVGQEGRVEERGQLVTAGDAVGVAAEAWGMLIMTQPSAVS